MAEWIVKICCDLLLKKKNSVSRAESPAHYEMR